MIFSSDSPHYDLLPGISVLVGGNVGHESVLLGIPTSTSSSGRWAAKDAREAQKGIVFAAFLKMLMPVLVVLPGIAAVVLISRPCNAGQGLSGNDEAVAGWFERPGVRRADRRDCIFPCIHDKQHLHDFHHGHVTSTSDPAKTSEKHLVNRGSYGRAQRNGDRHDRRAPLTGQFRSGLPVHPGVHRIFHTGNCRHFPAGIFLEAKPRPTGALGAAIGSAVHVAGFQADLAGICRLSIAWGWCLFCARSSAY